MRLISFRTASAMTLGVVADGYAIAAARLLPDGPATMTALLAGGDEALEALRAAADPGRIRATGDPLEGLPLAAPVPRPGKIIAIGRNYADHATEGGAVPPPAPLIFAKWPSSVIGPGEEIRWDPELTAQVDYEAELAVVIGRRARRLSEADALGHVLGYTCLNDVSARDLQFGDGQWVRGKSLDTFCPMGPQLVTLDELRDPNDLAIAATVNGEQRQSARTSEMLFSVSRLVAHCSQAFTLEAGDVIATGTPSGVGVYRVPPTFLTDGDVVRVSIEGIGDLANACRFDPS